ncbi:OmpA family protein [Christiangramia aquimixticola]|uniref:OmpA family protein n=1 Tax=Christiangramia aquimixticola TaxID=1697558 RepID=UPI003AA9438A
MKTPIILLAIFCFSLTGNAQILKKIKKSTTRAVENVIVNKTAEKASTETGKVMDTILNPKIQKQPRETSNKVPSSTNPDSNSAASTDLWTTYDFVPGSNLIFTDDLSTEKVGEFPSRWDLVRGNAENVVLNGEIVIQLNNKSIVTPLISSENYLSDVFTIEFDAYFENVYGSWQKYLIRFYKGDHSYLKLGEGNFIYPLQIQHNGASIALKESNNRRTFENLGSNNPSGFSGWKHIAISYNKRALKVYMDEERVLNIPNIQLHPEIMSIEGDTHKDYLKAIKNIRIAKGGLELYEKVMEEGKFITHGILFDVNKASIKPESGGILREISELLKTHTDLKFRIEGNTDSDGEPDYNLELSNKRAMAVKDALLKMGIEESRLEAQGNGEANPIADNQTAEGKAQNRRVEFIKL